MNMLNINLSNYKEQFSPQIPPGRYTVIVDDLETGVAKSSGNPKVTLWLRITEGPQAGIVLVDNLTITEKALFRVVGFMQAIGLQTPKKNLQVNLNTWRNKTLQVDVEDGEPYKGRVKSEVRGYLRPGDTTSETTAGTSDLADLEADTATVPEPTPSASGSTEPPATPESSTAGGSEPSAEGMPGADAVASEPVTVPAGAPTTLSLEDIEL